MIGGLASGGNAGDYYMAGGGTVGCCGSSGDCCKAGDTVGAGWVKLPAGGAMPQKIQMGSGTVSISNSTSFTGDGTLSCCEKKKASNIFYEYELKLYDLASSDNSTKMAGQRFNSDRLLLSVPGSVEVPAGTILKDVVMLKHATELAPLMTKIEPSDVYIDLRVLTSLSVKD